MNLRRIVAVVVLALSATWASAQPPSFGYKSWKPSVANAAALPGTGNAIGDARITLDDFKVMVWDGNSWETSASSGAGVTDGDKGDITVSGSGATWDVDADVLSPYALLTGAAFTGATSVNVSAGAEEISTAANSVVLRGGDGEAGSGTDVTLGPTSATLRAKDTGDTLSRITVDENGALVVANATGTSSNVGSLLIPTSGTPTLAASFGASAQCVEVQGVRICGSVATPPYTCDGADPVGYYTDTDTDALCYCNGAAWACATASADDQTATEVPYTPTTGTDWTDPDPTHVGGGLDALAARLTTEEAKADDDVPDAGEVAVSALAAGTDGELITWNSSGVAATVATGSSGQVLTSNGAGAAPTFQAAAGGGIGGSTGATDDAILIADGTGGATLAASAAKLTPAGSLTIPSAETIEFSTDVGLARVGAAHAKFTDGGAGLGALTLKATNSAGSLFFGGTAAGDTAFGLDNTGTFSLLLGDASNYRRLKLSGIDATGTIFSGTVIYAAGSTGATAKSAMYVGGVLLASGAGFLAHNGVGADSAAADVGLIRNAASVWRASDGSTGLGSILSGVLVEPNTAGSGAPNVIVANESGTLFTNEGATAENYENLPAAVAGLKVEQCVQDTDGMRFVAASGDTIRVLDKVTAAAGYISSTAIGSCVTLKALNATEWFATSIHGVWTDGTFTYDDTGLTAP